MFANIVKNQYIGKSKIDFTYQGKPIDGTNLIGDLCLPLENLIKVNPYNILKPYMPDYYVIGKVTDLCTMDIWDPKNPNGDILYITGIPKWAPNLNRYKLKNTKWESYYEDSYRGYLFQMLSVKEKPELIKLNRVNNFIRKSV